MPNGCEMGSSGRDANFRASTETASLESVSTQGIHSAAWREFESGMGSVAPRGAVLAMEQTPLFAQTRDSRGGVR